MFWLRDSLHIRIFVALAFVALFSTVGLGVVAYLTQLSALERQFSAELDAAVDFKKREITAWLLERKSDVTFLAQNSLNRQHLAAFIDPTTSAEERATLGTLLTATLADMQHLRTDYVRVFIAAPDGTILISPTEALVGQRVHNQAALGAVLHSEQTYIEDIFLDSSSGQYVMCFGHRLRQLDELGQDGVLGALFVLVDMDKSIYPMLNQWRDGKTGSAVLSRAEANGIRLLNRGRYTNTPPLVQLLPLAAPDQAKPAQLAAQGGEGAKLVTDSLGSPVMTVYRYLPESKWGLVLKMDTHEIYAPLRHLVFNVVFIAITVLALATLLSVFIARSLIQPLRRLVYASRSVAQGNLSVTVDVQRGDEIGKLAGAFSEMVAALARNQYQLKAANQVARNILSARPLDEVLSEIVQTAHHLTGAAHVALILTGREDESVGSLLRCKVFTSILPYGANYEPLSPVSESGKSQALVLRYCQLCLPDQSCHPLFATTTPTESLKIAIYGREQELGLWLVQPPTERTFTEIDHNTFATLSTYIAVALENERLLEKWRRWNSELEVQVTVRTYELAQANARLHELDEMKSDFIYNVSHELRNPISNLKLQLELLRNNATSPRRDKYITAMDKQVNLMALLVKDMLDLIQLEKMGNQLELHPVDLQRLLDALIGKYLNMPAQSVRLHWEVTPQSYMVKGAPLQLERAFDHLLRNAINFTPRGEVYVSLYPVDDKFCVEIKDTGIGIAAEDLPHIFQRFYRGSNVSQSTIPGSGLGLSLVQEVARLHHGQLAVESQLNQGTVLRFWIPCYQAVDTPIKIYG